MDKEISHLKIKNTQTARDGTTKFLLELCDGEQIECVLLIQDYGNTVCVSSQVGCKMRCAFCASGSMGFVRNLTANEMLAQVELAKQFNNSPFIKGVSPTGDGGFSNRLTHVVLMGIGEPLDNFDNVMEFLSRVDIGARKISISTCGLPDKIRAFADKKLQVNLCISLHAPNDSIRQRIMPIAKKHPMDELFSAVKYFFDKTKRRVIFEYALIDGVNCAPEHARELAHRLHNAQISYHVNLINLNSFNKDFKKPSRETAKLFMDTLIKNKVSCTMRKGRGGDIMAACGQLKLQEKSPHKAELSISLDPSMFINLEQYLAEINQLDGILIHLDFMRKSMVGADRCTIEQGEHVLKNAKHPVDVHIMASPEESKQMSEHFQKFSPRIICIHPESAIDIDAPIPNLSQVNVVTVMCVKAGKSGQTFNEKVLPKIEKIRKKYPHIRIIADGGINAENIARVKTAGADTLVVGSFIYTMPSATQRAQAVAELLDIVRK